MIRPDSKRTVAATNIPGILEGEAYEDFFSEEVIGCSPGLCFRLKDRENNLYFTCPGCSKMGHVLTGHPKPVSSPSWNIVSGSIENPETLTLSPSIHCVGCCGWHGYLTDGIFKSI